MQTLIIGMGNTLLSDSGAGIYALNFLRNFHSDLPGTKFLDGCALDSVLTPEIVSTDNLIVIDSSDLKSEPGSVKTLMGEQMDDYLNGTLTEGNKKIGLKHLMQEMHQVEILPQHRALISIQPKCTDEGDCLSQIVEDAIPDVCCRVINLIHEWH